MLISGIADEAGQGIEDQIRAHKELGWNGIELRMVDGKNAAAALPEEAFKAVADKLEEDMFNSYLKYGRMTTELVQGL